MSDEAATRVARLEKVRGGLAIAALLSAFGLYALGERQARRIDDLAARGEVVEAFVTDVSRDGRLTRYAYEAGGKRLDGAAEREAVPLERGQVFPILVSPADPSLSRVYTDRALAADEAARSRRFVPKLATGVGLVLGVLALLVHRDLVRARRGARFEPPTPEQLRRRMLVALGVMVLLAGLVAALHARDALARGQSLAPVAIGFVLSVAVVGGVFAAARGGDAARVRERAGKIARVAVPLLIALTLLRVLLTWLGKG